MALFLKNIRFPVYPLSNSITTHREENSILVQTSGGKEYILDDTSIKAESLGGRRLHIDKKRLYPLKRGIYTVGDFLLYTKIYKKFIDSNGKLIKYKSNTVVPLIYKKIISKIPYNSGMMLFLDKIHCPIYYHRQVPPGKNYVALLYIEKGFVLLGVTDKPSNRTTLKI